MNKRIAFLNLPFRRRIVRRYACTYHAENFYLPPLELMYLSSIAKQQEMESFFLDAIGAKLSLSQIQSWLEKYKPGYLVSLLGVESYSADLNILKQIKGRNPSMRIICLGYYPTIFPQETLEQHPWIDFVLKGEPERAFLELLKYFQNHNSETAQSCLPASERIYPREEEGRIENLDHLPFPDREQLEWKAYREFLSPQPFTTMLTSRGCPQGCTYCIPTYGKRNVSRSVENIIGEIRELVQTHRVRMVRFMDDDFCFDRDRVVSLSEMILKEGLIFQWSCLACPKHLDFELLSLMRKAGCQRIYVGVETFSERLLKKYRKNKINNLEILVQKMHESSIQCVGFFLISIDQTEEELNEDIARAIKCDFDHIIVSQVTAYPGTHLFGQEKEKWSFTLSPYQLSLKDSTQAQKLIEWEKKFYRSFYFRPKYLKNQALKIIRYPMDFIKGVSTLLQYRKAENIVLLARQDML